MRILVLDISGSTGWCLYDTEKQAAPLDYGTIVLPKPAREFASHPYGYVLAAQHLAGNLITRVQASMPLDKVVVEETNGARNRFTQKFLEYCHYAFLDTYFKAFEGNEAGDPVYINTSEWRKVTDTHLTREEKNRNARLSRHKRRARENGAKLDKKALGIAGKTTIKHAAIRRVRELYGIDLLAKDDDIADAILIGRAYIDGAKPCTGSEDR